jgi:peptidoglycan-N-acetylglucosamine deacetylase
MPTDDQELYLTFDDGPIPGPTEFVLDTLKQFSVKATFFCIGDNIRKHPEIFNRIVTEGHAVGNHTFNHVKGWSISLQAYVDNVKKCEVAIHNSQFTIHNSRLFRPPYGRITRNQIQALKHDYSIIMWDVLTADYKRSLSPEVCLRNSIGVTRPGSVIVFHDSLKAERNMRYALPRYIEHFLGKGYSFKPIHS